MSGKHAGLRTRYTARQRAEIRFRVFYPINPMPNRIYLARRAYEAWRADRARRNVDEQRAAIEPMQHGKRILAYLRQNTPGHGQLSTRAMPTRRQLRRMRHKSKLGGIAWERGERP